MGISIAARGPVRPSITFLDAGWLRRQGANALGVDPPESLNPQACADLLGKVGSDPLRLYWYDAAPEGRQSDFDYIADVPGIRLRLGHLQEIPPTWHARLKRALTEAGVDITTLDFEFVPERRQKGVDTLLTLDLVSLAQRRTFEFAWLIAGDRDFEEPVRLAQDEGCRINLFAPPGASIARGLRQLADGVHEISEGPLRSVLGLE